MHETLKDLALSAQPLSVLVQVGFCSNLLALQTLALLLRYLHSVHLSLPSLIQSLQPACVIIINTSILMLMAES